MIRTLKIVDLFCGCGGMSLGFQKAGYRIAAAYDSWPLAAEAYGKNFSHPIHILDLSRVKLAIEHIETYSPDIIIGGPPCQDFSIAGKRKEAQLANLTVAFSKIVGAIRPAIVVMENVYNIEKSPYLKSAVQVLKRNSYGITTRIIDASLVGVPQKRNRFFLIGATGLPDDFFGPQLDAGLSPIPMTIRKYFGSRLEMEFYYAHPRNYKRRGIFSIDEPSSTIRRVNRPLPDNYVRHPADKAGPSADIRPLTTKERAQVQTFPPSFKFSGSTSQQEHLIGNAVPVKLAEYVARAVKKAINNSSLNLASP